MQHSAFPGGGIDRTIHIVGGRNARRKGMDRFPRYYTDVPPVANSIKNIPVPPTSLTSLAGRKSEFKKHADEERGWLEQAQQSLQEHATENT